MTESHIAQKEGLDALADLVHHFGAIVEHGTKRLDLTPVRARTLFDLATIAPCTQRALATATGMTAQQTAVLVDALEGRGLVVRRRDASDRRAVSLELTDAGRERVAAIAAMRERMADLLLGHLDAQRAQLTISVLRDLATRAASAKH